MSATETVPFDLDDTTCAYRRDADEVLAAAFERAGVEPLFDRADWAAVAHEVEEAGSQACFRRTTMGTLAERRGRDVDHAHAVASGAQRDHGDVRFLPGAREALDGLGEDTSRARDERRPRDAGAGARGALPHRPVRGGGVRRRGDARRAPPLAVRARPRPAGDPRRAVHVGNSLASDVADAKASGVGAAWVPQRAGTGLNCDHDPDHTLDSLHDIHAVPVQL